MAAYIKTLLQAEAAGYIFKRFAPGEPFLKFEKAFRVFFVIFYISQLKFCRFQQLTIYIYIYNGYRQNSSSFDTLLLLHGGEANGRKALPELQTIHIFQNSW